MPGMFKLTAELHEIDKRTKYRSKDIWVDHPYRVPKDASKIESLGKTVTKGILTRLIHKCHQALSI